MAPRSVVERDAQVVADIRSRDALQEIFVKAVVPLARDIFLREDRRGQQNQRGTRQQGPFQYVHKSLQCINTELYNARL